MIDYLIVIPARYKSTRFPGKPLADINGKSMIKCVWEKCIEAANINRVIVATDDDRIFRHCKDQKIKVQLTSHSCLTGTDRMCEVAKKIKASVYINVQGDEPLISPEDIKAVIKTSQQEPKTIFNAMCPIDNKTDYDNLNIPKVVTRSDGRLLYMSRAPIPSGKNYRFEKAWKQVCIYAIPYDVLITFGSQKEKTHLESVEDIEILRLLEIGYEVKMIEVSKSSIAVDTLEDLKKVRSIIHD